MDTNGCSTGFSPRCFGKYHTITSCFLSSNHTPGAAGRWGGLNQPPAGFRDAPTQENQATPLARLQTAVSNTSPGLKANCLPLWQRAKGLSSFFFIYKTFSHTATAAQTADLWVLKTPESPYILLAQTWLLTIPCPIFGLDLHFF